jgi:segregation and condensation protein A
LGDQAFQLELPLFQGPLDALLQLIERRELEITRVSLALVADQFLEYVHSSEQVNPDDLADFLVIAARLMWIKSVALLPRPTPLQRQEAEEEAEDLTQRLLEYRAFRQAALSLGEREAESLRSYPRDAPPPPVTAPLQPIAMGELLRALERALLAASQEIKAEPVGPRRHRVEDKMRVIGERLRAVGRLRFESLVEPGASRDEVIATFLAVLEMLKAGQLDVVQDSPFGEITLGPARALAPSP